MEQLVIVVIFLVISLVNWMQKQAEEKREREAEERRRAQRKNQAPNAKQTERPAAENPFAPQAPPASSGPVVSEEEERMKRFFEALGLPVESTSPPPRQPEPQAAPPVPTPQPAQSWSRSSEGGVGDEGRPVHLPVPKILKPPPRTPAQPVARTSSQPVARTSSQPVSREDVKPRVAEPKPAAPAQLLSREEAEALERIKSGRTPAAIRGVRRVENRRGMHTDGAIGGALALLKSPGAVRQAIILREILDTPVSLRSAPSSQGF